MGHAISDDADDAALLTAYVDGSPDERERAFHAIARRHGGMVLATCRRWLRGDAAEDASQATFIVLARKAADIRDRAALPGWLHRTAWHIAQRAAAAARIGRTHEVASMHQQISSAPPAPDREDDRIQLLDQAIERLPDSYRIPLILHYLEGLPQAEVARRLGMEENAVAARLSRGRSKLRDRMQALGYSAAALPIIAQLDLPEPVLMRLSAASLPDAGARSAAIESMVAAPPSGWAGLSGAQLLLLGLLTTIGLAVAGYTATRAVSSPADAIRINGPAQHAAPWSGELTPAGPISMALVPGGLVMATRTDWLRYDASGRLLERTAGPGNDFISVHALPSGRLLVARQDRVPQSRRLDLFDVHGSRIASWPHPVKSFVVHANGLHALGRDGWSQHSEDGTVLAAGPPAPSQLSAAAVGPGSRLLVSERSGRLTAWDDPTNPAWYADVGSLPSAITPLDDGGAIIATTGAPANSAAAAGADAHQILPRIIRFDHAGRVLWSRTLDAAAIDVRLHQDGSVLVTLSGPDRATDGEFLGRSAVVCIGADGTTRWHAGFAVGDPIEALEPEADGGAIIGFRSGMVRWVDPEGAILRSHTLPGRVAQFMRLDDGSLLAAVHDRQPLVLLTP